MEADKQNRREPIHCNMILLLAFLPFVGRFFVFVALVVDNGMRIESGLDELRRVEQMFVEPPFKETAVQEVKNKCQRLADPKRSHVEQNPFSCQAANAFPERKRRFPHFSSVHFRHNAKITKENSACFRSATCALTPTLLRANPFRHVWFSVLLRLNH